MAEDGKIVYKVHIDASDAVSEAEEAGKKAGESLEKGTKSVSEDTKKDADLMSEVWVGAARKIGEAFVDMAARATGAIKDFVADSVKVGAEFDSSMSQVAATMGYSAEELNESGSEAAKTFEQLRNFAQEMGSTTAFSASQAADALNYMALAGYDAETSMEMLPTVLNLAAAGSIDLASASDMVTDAQSALGLSLDETTELVDQMAKTASKSNTSVAQLGEAILTVGGTASYMSGGTEELAAVLGVLADNGIKGAEGGTHLRNMLLSLSSPTDKAYNALESLGVSIFDAEGNMKSFAQIFPELNAAMEELTDEQKLQAFSDIFNTRDIAAATALMNTSVERWNELGTAIENAGGAAATMAEVQLDNLSGDMTMFQSALEGAQIAVSDMLEPALRGLVQTGTDSIAQLTEAMREDGISGAMEVGIQILESLATSLVESIPEIAPSIVQVMMQLAQFFIESLPMILEVAIEIILALADGLIEALPELIPAIVQVILAIVEKLTEPETITKLIEAAFKIIAALAKGLIQAIPELIKAVPEIIMNLLQAFVESWPAITEGGVQLLAAFGEGILSAIGSLMEIVGQVTSAIRSAISGLVSAALSWGKDLVDNLVKGIKSKINSVKSAVSSIADAVKKVIGFSEPEEGPLSNFHEYAPDMVELFAKGLKDSEIVLTRTVKDVFDLQPAIDAALAPSFSLPQLASESMERSVSSAISNSSTSYGDVTYYVYNTIDAHNVKDFNDVVDLLSSAETVRRMG